MTRDELVRKLRDLRRLERRLHGLGSGENTPVWDHFFSLEQGRRVRYPFVMLLAFDRPTRERAFREFLLAIWSRTTDRGRVSPGPDDELLAVLGLVPGADPAEVRSAFRRLALELHPDVGGDEEEMSALIERYRSSTFGRGAGA